MPYMNSIVPLLLLFSVLFAGVHGALKVSHLAKTYTLTSGHMTACPRTVTYGPISTSLSIPTAGMKVDSLACKGPGGKKLRAGSQLRDAGLILPTLLTHSAVRFFAGVESATRVCGAHAFNASTISYYLASTSDTAHRDAGSGIAISPGYMYAVYTHFVHPCVYKAKLTQKEIEAIAASEKPSLFSDSGPDAQGLGNSANNSNPVCFPANARVDTPQGVRRIDSLQVGDKVLVGHGNNGGNKKYSEIFSFSHRDPYAVANFVRIVAASGATLEISPGHLLYVDGRLVPAGTAKVGDIINTINTIHINGVGERIVEVDTKWGVGLYAPHTLHGNIVVNDVVASCYTQFIQPNAAHALLAPLRVALIRASLKQDVVDGAINSLRNLASFIPSIF